MPSVAKASVDRESFVTTLQTLASWASSLTLADIPDDVRDLLRAQRLSVLGGIAASKHNETADRVLTGMGIDRSETISS